MSMSLLLGALVGCIMGLTGAGGGILAIPLLVFGLHLSVPQAGPIGLLAVGIASQNIEKASQEIEPDHEAHIFACSCASRAVGENYAAARIERQRAEHDGEG